MSFVFQFLLKFSPVLLVPAEAEIKRWYSCEVNTLIFVWHHAENEEPSWYPQPIPNVHPRKWWYRGRTEYYVNSHIQVSTYLRECCRGVGH